MKKQFNAFNAKLIVGLVAVVCSGVTVPSHAAEASNIIENTSYIDNQDGTITDTKTKLIWKRCSEGQTWTGSSCVGDVSEYTWQQAKNLRHSYAGYSDWRLPTIRELNTLVYCSNGKPVVFKNNGFGQKKHEGSIGCISEKRGEFQRPTIHHIAFPQTLIRPYWSTSPVNLGYIEALTTHFYIGADGGFGVNESTAVRLVRGAK